MSKRKELKAERLQRFRKAYQQTVSWRHPNRPKGRHKASHRKHRPS